MDEVQRPDEPVQQQAEAQASPSLEDMIEALAHDHVMRLQEKGVDIHSFSAMAAHRRRQLRNDARQFPDLIEKSYALLLKRQGIAEAGQLRVDHDKAQELLDEPSDADKLAYLTFWLLAESVPSAHPWRVRHRFLAGFADEAGELLAEPAPLRVTPRVFVDELSSLAEAQGLLDRDLDGRLVLRVRPVGKLPAPFDEMFERLSGP